jgi:sugar lactone lactonase YvrE
MPPDVLKSRAIPEEQMYIFRKTSDIGDVEGVIWVASPEGGANVMRLSEGGEITHRIKVERQPFAAMLGGPQHTALFICTSILSGESPGSGRIETVEVEVPGAGFP